MAELDELLSTTLKRIAPPAESSGVADAIRARVEAGDAGISAASSTAPGWGGGGAVGWLPWIGIVVVAGLVGGGVGWSGVAGAATEETVVAGTTSVLDAVVDAGSCPGGPVVRTLSADTRVLAVARSEDSSYLGVRNPDDVAATIWVPASVVVPDDAAGLDALPVGAACPVVTITVPEPVVVVPVAPTPEKPKPGAPVPPPPAPDTTPPALGLKPTVQIQNCLTTVKLTATDNVGVTSVSVSMSGANTGTRQMQLVAGVWQLVLNATTETVHDGNTTFTMTAKDAAGNSSPTKAISGKPQCLI